MSTAVISKRYARALLNLAEKENQVEKVTEGLNDVADTIVEAPQALAFLMDPKITQTDKLGVVREILQQTKAPPLVDSFIRLLAVKRRIQLIQEIRNLFHAIADERLGRAKAEVTVAKALGSEEEEALRKKLEKVSGKQITLSVNVEPEIIGGVIAKIGSTVRDGSLRHQLKNIRQTTIEG